jgi:hypothetical protein
MRGLEIKEDTYAILKVVLADGSELPLADAGAPEGRSTSYTNFLLQSVTESRMEKHQILETFGEAYVFFFGEHPRFLDVTAVLLASHDFNWEAEFWHNYEHYLRGTKLAEMGARTYLFYDDNVVEGYMLGATAVKTSEEPLAVRLSFRLFVTRASNVSFVGDPAFPIHPGVHLPEGITASASPELVGLGGLVSELGALDEEARFLAAQDAADRQADGFGGGQGLADALRSGIAQGNFTSPDLTGYLVNAAQALYGTFDAPPGVVRTKPLRGKIADNADEYTQLPPAPPRPPPPPEHQEVDDLPTSVVRHAEQHGAKAASPKAMGPLGLLPKIFGSVVTYSPRPGVYVARLGSPGAAAPFGTSSFASLGARASFDLDARATFGLRGGPGAPFGAQAALSARAEARGITTSSSSGITPAAPAVAAQGAPSAFALVSVPGTLQPAGTIEERIVLTPDGTTHTSRRTGIFAD